MTCLFDSSAVIAALRLACTIMDIVGLPIELAAVRTLFRGGAFDITCFEETYRRSRGREYRSSRALARARIYDVVVGSQEC